MLILFSFFCRRIYPQGNEDEYEPYFTNSCSLFQETAASKARIECARLQREEIKMKSQFIESMRRKNGLCTGNAFWAIKTVFFCRFCPLGILLTWWSVSSIVEVGGKKKTILILKLWTRRVLGPQFLPKKVLRLHMTDHSPCWCML